MKMYCVTEYEYKKEHAEHKEDDLKFHEECEENKKNFPEGPWNKEPNKIYFQAHGFECIIKRHAEFGHLCGYVGVPKGHPMFNVSSQNEKCLELNVHGSLTYSNECQGDICHPGKNKVFWLGFDCAHNGDYIPKITPVMYGKMPYNKHLKKTSDMPAEAFVREDYKDVEFVKEECIRLAEQLSEMV